MYSNKRVFNISVRTCLLKTCFYLNSVTLFFIFFFQFLWSFPVFPHSLLIPYTVKIVGVHDFIWEPFLVFLLLFLLSLLLFHFNFILVFFYMFDYKCSHQSKVLAVIYLLNLSWMWSGWLSLYFHDLELYKWIWVKKSYINRKW